MKSRREFLKQTAVVVGTAVVAPSLLRGEAASAEAVQLAGESVVKKGALYTWQARIRRVDAAGNAKGEWTTWTETTAADENGQISLAIPGSKDGYFKVQARQVEHDRPATLWYERSTPHNRAEFRPKKTNDRVGKLVVNWDAPANWDAS